MKQYYVFHEDKRSGLVTRENMDKWLTEHPEIPREAVREVFTFDAGYGRVGTIEVSTGCDVCENHDVPSIMIDGSEGEYGGGSICFPCLVRMLESMVWIAFDKENRYISTHASRPNDPDDGSLLYVHIQE